MAIASKNAKFNFIFGKLNLVPDQGGLFLLQEKVGREKALDIYVRSSNLSVQELVELGIVETKVVDHFRDGKWQSILMPYLDRSKEALAVAKKCLWEDAKGRFFSHLDIVTTQMCELLEHPSALRQLAAGGECRRLSSQPRDRVDRRE